MEVSLREVIAVAITGMCLGCLMGSSFRYVFNEKQNRKVKVSLFFMMWLLGIITYNVNDKPIFILSMFFSIMAATTMLKMFNWKKV